MWYVNIACVCALGYYFVRFILTMWYVNNGGSRHPREAANCFILTMWYVNLSFCFYTFKCIAGFILTMWYVN